MLLLLGRELLLHELSLARPHNFLLSSAIGKVHVPRPFCCTLMNL
jgi:hypothetical protein